MESAPVVNHDLEFSAPLEIALGKRRYTIQLEAAREDLTDAKVNAERRDGETGAVFNRWLRR